MTSEKKKTVLHVLVLVVLSLFLFFWKIGELNFFGTEPYRALPARTMMETGNWWVPMLAGRTYLMKPPLSYWLISLFSLFSGKVTETSARLPSALSAMFLVLLLYWFGRLHAGRTAGFLSGLIGLTSGLIFEKAVAAEIDVNLTLWVSGSLLLFYNALDREEKRFANTLGAYVCLSLAFLSKGPPALIFFFSTLLVFLFWEKRLRFLRSAQHLVSLAIFLAIVLSWAAVVISKVGWSTLMESGAHEFASRASHFTSLRVGDIFYYPVNVLGAFFPWSLFLPLAVLPSYYRTLSDKERRLQRFLLCGVLANLLLFSMAAGKENRYLVPIYPLMALMAGIWWAHLFESSARGREEWYLKNLSRIIFAVFSGAAILIVAQPIFNVPRFSPSPLVFLGLSAVGVAGLFFSQKANYRGVFASLVLIFLVFKLIYVLDYVPYKNNRYAIKTISDEISRRTEPGRIVYTVDFNKVNIFFYMDNPVIRLDDLDQLYEKAESRSPTWCLLKAREIKQMKQSYGIEPAVIYEFVSSDGTIALACLSQP